MAHVQGLDSEKTGGAQDKHVGGCDGYPLVIARESDGGRRQLGLQIMDVRKHWQNAAKHKMRVYPFLKKRAETQTIARVRLPAR